ncbi:MAG: threonine--tRNA ligase [Thaumarchaeota archaeon]|nr:threonine--tRNA ligase [Nitrososphaerota archaeon]
MKILQMHADFIEYTPVKKEIRAAEEAEAKTVREDDVVVLFTAFEEGDDVELVRQAVREATEFLSKLGTTRVMIYPFAHLSQNLASPSEALSLLLEMEKEAKAAGLEVRRAPFGWTKALQVKVKGHPLAEMSRSYSHAAAHVQAKAKPKHELTETELLSRIKKSDFGKLPESDHRVIGEKLDLFSFQEPSPGMPYWHDKGMVLKDLLMDFVKREQRKQNYLMIGTPALANTNLWRVSGHWDHYKDGMFLTSHGDEEFGLKPMNCPSTFLFYKTRKWSYRDLPLRVADFDPLFRNELSGVASGLFRVKTFVQDDAHIFVTEEQIVDELKNVIDLMARFYGVFNLKYTPKVSTMPDDHLGTKEQWDRAVAALVEAVEEKGIKPVIKEKEGAFYGPKIDVDVKDSEGREWQCATIQLDFQMPQRFKLTYTGADGKEHTPAVIHRVIYGSLERFIGVILEHFKGALPIWISPVQVRVIPLSDENQEYSKKILSTLLDAGVRAEGSFEGGTMGAKIRDAQLQKIPYMLVVGKKEEDSKTVAVRTRSGERTFGVKVEDFVSRIKADVAAFK